VITGVIYFNTTYGREVYLQLEGQTALMCNKSGFVRGDIEKHYVVGERYKTTLHFESYDFNNLHGVWAEELVCPVPVVFESMGVVLDAISYVMGFYFLPVERNDSGWTSYEVITRDGGGYPLDLVNASLIKGVFGMSDGMQVIDTAASWITAATAWYVAISGGYRGMPVIDEIQSLENGTSRNGTMRFADVNGNGVLDDGDRFNLLMGDRGDPGYQTYFLSIGGGMWPYGYVRGVKIILNGAHGPYQFLITHDEGGEDTHLRLVEEQIGPKVISIIEVAQNKNATPMQLSQVDFKLKISGQPGEEIKGSLADLPVTTPDDVTIGYSDFDGNGLDAGDRFTIGGIANRTGLTLEIWGKKGSTISGLSWIAGYGRVIGNIPQVELSTQDTHSPFTINVSVPWLHQELNLSRHLTVSLWENSTMMLDNITLANGSMNPFPGGSLTFIDGDADGFLSSRDYFVLHGNPQSDYKIEIYVLWGYATFSKEFGPI